jgi:23S rRNA (cytosine1962-C5)-methyltransferase
MITVMTAQLKPKEERRLLQGHRWAYRNEFARLPKITDGDLLDVSTQDGKLLGRGFFQEEGGIAVRMLDATPIRVDADFWRARLDAARLYRERCFPGSAAYRWVFGESDALPGLVIDRYGPLAMAQTTCAFYAQHEEALAAAVLETPGVGTLVFEKSGKVSRHGVEREAVEVEVEGMKIRLPLEGNQKTGLFLDQRCNRLVLEPWCKGARVLDGHCYHGLWSLHAARGGAASVLAVDTSAEATARAKANAEMNGYGDVCAYETCSIEDKLAEDTRYDVVIIDPPAYAKSRAHAPNALKRYRALNAAAMARVEPGGILVSCSCSHFVSPEEYLEIIRQAAIGARRQVWLIEMRGAAPDHPVHFAMPETSYLKCAVLRVL